MKQHFAALVISHQYFLKLPFQNGLPCYWQFLPTYEPNSTTKKKHVYMTFKAISATAPAFQFFFSCTIKCPHTEAVLLFTETFQITNEHLCFGTATRESKQSWSFFLLNLRQALLHYCSEVRDWRRLVFL